MRKSGKMTLTRSNWIQEFMNLAFAFMLHTTVCYQNNICLCEFL